MSKNNVHQRFGRRRDRTVPRFLSAVGPGDVVSAHDDWVQNIRTLSETSITFSSQEFEAFAAMRAVFWAVSTHPRKAFKSAGENRIENRPRHGKQPKSGLAYYIGQARYAASLLRSAVQFRATHLIIDSGTTSWFMLVGFAMFRIKVIPNFHNVMWPAGHPPTRLVHRLVLKLDGLFLRSSVRFALGVSPECGRQLAQIAGAQIVYFDYRAQFVGEEFHTLPPPRAGTPMTILFAGRLEANKGVFDLLEICERLNAREPGRFVFEVCGGGAAMDGLQAAVERVGAAERFRLRGKLARPELLEIYGKSHLVIVPTTSDFCEGLPQVCAEAVLAGRPVITSRVSNALEALQGAVVEVREDDIEDYVQKILAVASDPTGYKALVANTGRVQDQFMDRSRGLAAAITRCLEASVSDCPR